MAEYFGLLAQWSVSKLNLTPYKLLIKSILLKVPDILGVFATTKANP
jgi:hypothetical protein